MYIVYDLLTTMKIKSYNKESTAKAVCTRKNNVNPVPIWGYCSEEFYIGSVIYKKKVKNLMTGEDVEIDSNTPLCCDPSSESYWSM